MNHPQHLGRWFAAGVSVLALAGAGTVAATTPPTDPADTAMGTTAATDGMGAGPSDCPAVTVETIATESTATDAAGTAPADTEMAATTEAVPGTEAAGTEATAATSPDTTDTTATVPAPSGPFVQIAETDLYGPILVDSECRSLYGFDSDVDGAPTCVDECAEEWPPLFVPGDEVPALADELDPSLFSVVEHADGPMLKVDDFPLYYFEHDTAPGDTTGQGVGPEGEGFGGVWFLVAPDGTPIEVEEAGAATSAPGATTPMDTAGAVETTTG